jgi:tricorn protease
MAIPARRGRVTAALPLLMLAMSGPAGVAANGEATRMLRSPTVSATRVAFAYANNIWVADRAGGTARRLTSFQGQASNPKFSPD